MKRNHFNGNTTKFKRDKLLKTLHDAQKYFQFNTAKILFFYRTEGKGAAVISILRLKILNKD